VSSHDRQQERQRLDKWLWCVRFYKTRALATQAVSGGKIKVNGERVKPAHNLRVGDRLSLSLNAEVIDVGVQAFPERRGSAGAAMACYAETAASLERRSSNREQRRLASLTRPRPNTRPDKRERRQLERLRRGQA
jgi:ribosome-associated heat shock protein Hsp15